MFLLYLLTLPPEAQDRFFGLWESSRVNLIKYVHGKLSGIQTYKDCEDIVEDAFIRIMERYDSYRDMPDGTLKAIIIRTCDNLCKNERVRGEKIAFTSADDMDDAEEAKLLSDTDSLTPEEIVISEDGVRRIKEILLSMQSVQREILQMKILERMPYPRIAEELEISEDTARQRVSRARNELIRKLKEAGYER